MIITYNDKQNNHLVFFLVLDVPRLYNVIRNINFLELFPLLSVIISCYRIHPAHIVNSFDVQPGVIVWMLEHELFTSPVAEQKHTASTGSAQRWSTAQITTLKTKGLFSTGI